MPTPTPTPTPTCDGFDASRVRFERVCEFMGGPHAAGLTHAEMEAWLDTDGRELLRQLYQDHLDLRAAREQRLAGVADADGTPRPAVEAGHTRPLATIFGQVSVTRLAYRACGQVNLHPADAALNLPVEVHSHGLRRLCAIESARGSFDQARQALGRACGAGPGKRQVEALTVRAAADFDAFYARPRATQAEPGDTLVLSADGKGIVMRPEALRPGTAKAAAAAAGKLKTRLSKGEKTGRKRMAELGALYDATPVVRSLTDIIGRDDDAPRPPAPKACNKWLTASVVQDTATVIASIFDQAQLRDPAHQRTWIALVDGARHQIDRINTEAERRHVKVPILVDFV